MLPNIDTHNGSHWLTRVSYLEDKAKIVAEFSSQDSKRTIAYPFMPFAYLNTSMFNQKEFAKLAGEFAGNKFSLSFTKKDTAKITARTFSSLRNILFNLKSATAVSYLLINPERQFLVSKEWSYFDCFSLEKEHPEKKALDRTPKIRLNDFNKNFDVIAEELLYEDKKLFNNFLERIICSNILRVEPTIVPSTFLEQSEILLENMFFRNCFVTPPVLRAKSKTSTGRNLPFYDAEAIDFSLVWLSLLVDEKHNLGFETLNCDCCKPTSSASENLLSNSLVEVSFLADGTYFESLSESWADSFHDNNPNKEERERYKQESFSAVMPSGPFFRNQKHEILVADALALEAKGLVKTGQLTKPVWFCRNKDSFLKQELRNTENKLAELKEQIIIQEKNSLKHGLVEYSKIYSDIDYLFLVSYHSSLNRIVSRLPNYLLIGGKHFSPELSNILGLKQREIMFSFRDFCSRKGARVVFKGNTFAYAKGRNIASISREFSKISSLKCPELKITP